MQLIWSRKTTAPPRGLSLARERGCFLVWDADHNLQLFNRSGEPQARIQTPESVMDACCADDGSCFAAVDARGQVWLLAPDLSPLWERTLPQRGAAVALDPFGQYLAAGDGSGATLFDAKGRSRWRVDLARPPQHMAFVPERPALVVAADFGLVACYDLSGNVRWRDSPLAHDGDLAVSGDGAVIALACFSDGLVCYSVDDAKRRSVGAAGPCRLAAVSYDGDAYLTASLENKLHLRGGAGQLRGEWSLESAPTALALAALGEECLVALTDGSLLSLHMG